MLSRAVVKWFFPEFGAISLYNKEKTKDLERHRIYNSLVITGYNRTFDTFRKTYQKISKKQKITELTEINKLKTVKKSCLVVAILKHSN